MFEPLKLESDTASFAQLITPSSERGPKSAPSWPWYMPLRPVADRIAADLRLSRRAEVLIGQADR